MLTLRKGDPGEHGVWFDCKPEDFEYHRAFVSCPVCNGTISLRGRLISHVGIAFPPVVCPHEDCKFNKCVQLAGWDKGRIERGAI